MLQGLGFRQWHKDYDEFEERRSELNCFQSKWNLIFVKKVNKREEESHQRRNFKETSVDISPLINVRPQMYFYFSIVSSLNTVLRNQIFTYFVLKYVYSVLQLHTYYQIWHCSKIKNIIESLNGLTACICLKVIRLKISKGQK